MNQNVGASFGLSVLVVVFFAVILYQPDAPAPDHVGGGPGSAPAEDPPRASPAPVADPGPVSVSVPETGPAPPETEPVRPELSVAPSAVVVVNTAANPSSATLSERRKPEAAPKVRSDAVRPASHEAARPLGLREARAAITQARPGEALADVARRVYGSPDATSDLWLANRDLLERADAPLPPGALLRTPWPAPCGP
jgi:hypothetical protein